MMKRDRLERFILENREQFDLAEPGAGIWSNIDRALPGQAQTIVHFIQKRSRVIICGRKLTKPWNKKNIAKP